MAGSDDRLQQYFDGELAGDAADAIRREVEERSDVRAKLDGLERLRALLAHATAERSREVDSDALFAAITAELEAPREDDDPMLPDARPPTADGPKLSVIPGGERSDGRALRRKKTKPQKTNVVWIGAAVLTVAAAVLLVVRPPSPASEGTPTEAPLAALTPQGSEVVDVDFGYNTGAVFSVEGNEGERIAVVWISDASPLGDEGVERLQVPCCAR